MTRTDRRAAWIVAVVGALAFVALVAWRVPWSPVPGGAPDPVSATSVLSPVQVDRAESFSWWARAWSWSSLGLSLAFAAFWGFTRWGRRLVARLPGPWWLQVPEAVTVLEVGRRALTLPLALAQHQHFEDYGLTHQTWSGFAVDIVLAEAVTVVTTTLGLLVLIGCARRWRARWPVVVGFLAGGLVMLGSYGYPVVVEPLFNSFMALPSGDLRAEILALADQEGVRIDDVLVADASKRTTTINAYVSGFGGTRRVVLYDNLVEDLPRPETLSVVAHELAHAKYDDVLTGSLIGAAGGVFAIGLLGLLIGRERRLAPGDPRVVPLLLALLAVGTFLADPVENAISRRIETRADVTALETTHDPAAFAALQRELMLRSLADPTPPGLSQLWFGSHPTALERIAIAEAYEP